MPLVAAQLVDLPCIVETHKTLDRRTLLKSGDMSQMVVCSRGSLDEDDREEKVEEMTAAKKKDLYKKFVWNHGSEYWWRRQWGSSLPERGNG